MGMSSDGSHPNSFGTGHRKQPNANPVIPSGPICSSIFAGTTLYPIGRPINPCKHLIPAFTCILAAETKPSSAPTQRPYLNMVQILIAITSVHSVASVGSSKLSTESMSYIGMTRRPKFPERTREAIAAANCDNWAKEFDDWWSF